MNSLINYVRYVLFFMLILCFLPGCENAPQLSSFTATQVENPPSFSQQYMPVDGELLNSEEMVKEHLRLIDNQKVVFQKLLDENSQLLCTISEQMLQLQSEECSTNPTSSQWKHPLFDREKGLIWESDSVSEESQLLLLSELESRLNTLSEGEVFSQAFPDLNQRIITGNVCQFTQELTDSLGYHFCYVSLNYSPEEQPIAQPFFSIEWIDKHWFFYVEWHE